MSFSALPNEIVLLVAKYLPASSVTSLVQTNSGLASLLTPLVYDHASTHHKPILPWASERGFENLTTGLLNRGISIDRSNYTFGNSPLLLAASNGHANLVALFLQRFPEECVTALDCNCNASHGIELAAGHGHIEVVQVLLPYCIDKDLSAAAGEAASNGHTDILKLFIPYVSTISCSISLHGAAANGHVETVALLLSYADPARLLAPIESASWAGHREVVELLVPLLSNTEDLLQAVTGAAGHGHVDILQILLEHLGVEERARVATEGLREAIKGGHEGVVDMLLKAGADVNITLPPEQPLLHWLGEFGMWVALTKGRTVEGIVASVLHSGGDVTVVDRQGRTPLHMAAMNGVEETRRRIIIKSRSDLRVIRARVDMAKRAQGMIVQSLVAAGVNVNARDASGTTAFHEAAKHGEVELVAELLKFKPDLELMDRRGRTAQKLAMEFLHREGIPSVIKLIDEYHMKKVRVVNIADRDEVELLGEQNELEKAPKRTSRWLSCWK